MMGARLTPLLVLLTSAVLIGASLPLEDATATVDQLFAYQLDPTDFPADSHVKVTETGSDSLPSWLTYDSEKYELSGVPTSKDRGTYILSVGDEVFAVTVRDSQVNQVAQPTNSDEQILCKPHDSITVAYVKLDSDIPTLPTSKRSRLVRDLSDHLSLKSHLISLTSEPTDLVKSSAALVSGPGDTPLNDQVNGLSTISWIVGCGAVKSHHMDILECLETSAKNGDLAKSLGVPVLGWQVQSNQPKIVKARRLKRNVRATATPVPSQASVPATTTSTTTTTTEATVKPTAVVTVPSPDPATEPKTTPKSSSTTSTTTTPTTPTSATPKSTVPTKPPSVFKVNNDKVPASLTAYPNQLFRWKLPADLLINPDGLDVHYELVDREATMNSVERLKPWLVDQSGEIYGLPSSDMESQSEEMTLKAVSSAGSTIMIPITINVAADKTGVITEFYTITVMSTQSLRKPVGVVYSALTLQETLTLENPVVIIESMSNSKIVIKFGDNRGMEQTCPQTANEDLLSSLKSKLGKSLMLLGENAADYFQIKSIDSVKPMPPCENQSPMVDDALANKVKTMQLVVGRLYEEELPAQLFKDREDDDNVRLTLYTDGSSDCQDWICLKGRMITALTWDELPSQPQLELVATDTGDLDKSILIDASIVTSYKRPTHSFTLTLDGDYSSFIESHQKRVDLYRKLSSAFADDSVLTIESVKKGSIVVGFILSNDATENAGEDNCPISAVKSFSSSAFSDGKINPAFMDSLKPFSVKKLELSPADVCEGEVDPMSADIEKPTDPGQSKKEDNMMIIIIVVVVVVVLIIIIVVVVVVVKRRQAHRTQYQTTGRIEKGVPRVLEEDKKALDKPEEQALLTRDNASNNSTPKPPAYHPETPPASETDEHDRSL